MDTTHLTTLVEREAGAPGDPDLDEQMFWSHYWDCEPCCYADRTGDRTSVTLMSDFYSTRQLHASGMYVDYLRPANIEHGIMVCLPSTLSDAFTVVAWDAPGVGHVSSVQAPESFNQEIRDVLQSIAG